MTVHEAEQMWLTSTDALRMYDVLRPFRSFRKHGLLGCAIVRAGGAGNCTRTIATAEEYAEGRIDALTLRLAWNNSLRRTVGFGLWPSDIAAPAEDPYNWCRAMVDSPELLNYIHGDESKHPPMTGLIGYSNQCNLIRNVMGNPWRSHFYVFPEASPYLTPTVIDLAQEAYKHLVDDWHLDPERLQVLSDALEDTGYPTEVTSREETVAGANCPVCWKSGFKRYALDFAHGKKLRCWDCGNTWTLGDTLSAKVTEPNRLLAHLRSPEVHVRGCWSLDLILRKE